MRSLRLGLDATILAGSLLLGTMPAHAELTLLGQFSPGVGTPVGCGFDRASDGVWVYGEFGTTLPRFSRGGIPLGSVGRPGASANDVDVSFTAGAMTLGTTAVPARTLLFIDGESGVAEIYAVDKLTGSVMATLTTGFGASHVVGGAYHPDRNTFFLVQDRQPAGTASDNIVAEIDPVTGAVVNSFAITAALVTFTVNFGDLEVGTNGNLYIVSSDETTILELSPSGAFVQELALPAGVASLSGIGLDNSRGEAWVSGSGGVVWRLGGLPASQQLGQPLLTVAKGAGGVSVLDWSPVPGATGYDVVQGDLPTLRETGGDFTLATADCIADDVASPPVQDSLPLAIDEARWYVVRATNGPAAGSYDSGSPRQVGSRDLEIADSAPACP